MTPEPQAKVVPTQVEVTVIFVSTATMKDPMVVAKEHLAGPNGELHEQVVLFQNLLHLLKRLLLSRGQG